MAEYRLTNKAVDDLNGIWDYTYDNWSEDQADIYYNMLVDFCQNIANKPDLGKSYKEIRTDLFGLKVNRHIIFYRKISADLVEITRILHGRMDLKKRMIE